jgi:hypothetical protein
LRVRLGPTKRSWFAEAIEESNFSAIIDLLVNCGTFLFVGLTMPFAAWHSPDLTLTPWRLVILAIAILLVRRIPAIFALQRFVPDIHTWREALFCGWFGAPRPPMRVNLTTPHRSHGYRRDLHWHAGYAEATYTDRPARELARRPLALDPARHLFHCPRLDHRARCAL